MTIRIAIDSTCDLPLAVTARLGIGVVPCCINIGERSYLDGVDLARQEFYQRLPTYNPTPKTAAPGVQVFLETYQKLIADGATEILSIHLASSLSAVLNVARIAAEEVTDARVRVFDSRSLSLGAGFLAEAAVEAAARGAALAEIETLLQERVTRTHAMALVDTLEYLHRGGRISRLELGLGALLQIKPVLQIYDGEILAEKTRTAKGARERLSQLLGAMGAVERWAILHTHCPERADELRQLVQPLFADQPPRYTVEVTPVLGAHFGPGMVGLAYVAAKSNR